MRKHLYLITEHEDETRVGQIKFTDQKHTWPEKNEVGPIKTFDEEEEDFETLGKQVGLGYADFEDEDDVDERAMEVIQNKLADIDEEYVEQAGLDLEELAA